MNNYPEYHQWQSLLLGQYSGELAWCAFITGLLLLWLLWRRVFNRWQVLLTFAGVAAFYVSIVVTVINQTLNWSTLLFCVPLAVYLLLKSDDLVSKLDSKAHWDIVFFAALERLYGVF